CPALRRSRCGFCSLSCKDTPSTAIYTLSLHDALPIFDDVLLVAVVERVRLEQLVDRVDPLALLRVLALERLDALALLVDREIRIDRKSTRLNSSHVKISYAVFCLQKKNH